jgi:hypothetical protein
MNYFPNPGLLVGMALASALLAAPLQAVQNAQIPAAPDAVGSQPKSDVRCHSGLQSYSAWVKPGNALIPKMAHVKEGSERLDFDTGKSAFIAVRYSDIKPGQKIQVMLVRDMNLTKLSSVLLPDYVLLDQNFCEISAKKKLVFIRKKWVSALSNAAETADIVVAPDERPAFVLLYSDAVINGQEVSFKDEFGLKMATTIRTEYGYLNLQAVKSK